MNNSTIIDERVTEPAAPQPPTPPLPNTGKAHWKTPSRPIRGDAIKKGRKQPLPIFTYN